MLVDFRPHTRLRGTRPVDLTSAVTPVVEALSEGTADLARARVVCDWVQYRENFRDVVDVRPILARAHHGAEGEWAASPRNARYDDVEIAVDVRRSAGVALKELTAVRLREGGGDRVHLEGWGAGSASCIWEFNALYWSALALWEKVTGQTYAQTVPVGESVARNRHASRELIRELFAVWDPLARSGALPEQLYVVELGPGHGGQAKVFLDEFRDLDRAHGWEYYRRLHYVMCGYSQHVLDLGNMAVSEHSAHVSSITMDAAYPRRLLGFLRYKVFLVRVSNVYDNLPTDEVAQLGGCAYQVQTRAYLPAAGAAALAEHVSARVDQLPGLASQLLRLGPRLLADTVPEHFGNVDAAVEFWRRIWSLIRLAERYVPLADLDPYVLAPSLSGEVLRPMLESGADVRMHVSNGALASFTDSLMLLHPCGKLVCDDLFVTDVQSYRDNFRGPGKYGGSVVNWVNGPLMAHVGRVKGFDVDFAPSEQRSGGNITTMTAR
jgi:hypothetical protein